MCLVIAPGRHLRLGAERVELAGSLKYLGILLENKGTLYGEPFRFATDKAQRVMSSLCRLMPKIGGPREHRRRLLVGVAHSVLLYRDPTWVPSLELSPAGHAAMVAVQRRAALRCVSAYRTVSLDAALVAARLPPIDLLALERFSAYDAKRAAAPVDTGLVVMPDGAQPRLPASHPRMRTLAKWSGRLRGWDPPEGSGRAWTRTMIPPGLLGR